MDLTTARSKHNKALQTLEKAKCQLLEAMRAVEDAKKKLAETEGDLALLEAKSDLTNNMCENCENTVGGHSLMCSIEDCGFPACVVINCMSYCEEHGSHQNIKKDDIVYFENNIWTQLNVSGCMFSQAYSEPCGLGHEFCSQTQWCEKCERRTHTCSCCTSENRCVTCNCTGCD